MYGVNLKGSLPRKILSNLKSDQIRFNTNNSSSQKNYASSVSNNCKTVLRFGV